MKKKKETEENQTKKVKEQDISIKTKEKRIQVIAIVVTICVVILIVISILFALMNINNDKIIARVNIEGIDVSNLTKEEAMEKVKKTIDEKVASDITLKYEEYETTFSLGKLDVKYNIEKAIEEAYAIGRKGNIITNNYSILFTLLFSKDINAEVYVDTEKVEKEIGTISANLPGAVIESSYYIEENDLIITKGTKGITVDKDSFSHIINQRIENLTAKNEIISIPIKEKEPDKIDIEKIHQEIYKEPQDAYVKKDPIEVHMHVNGVDFAITIEEAKELLKEEKEEYMIPLKITMPEKTIYDLGEEAFPATLGTYTTRYDASNKNRSTNISLAAAKIDGTVILPGETFSYNQVVGKRTVEAGYKEAAAYAGGKVVQDVGGGICQVSSTLYNTVLLANLKIEDRSNHHFLTSYVPAGRDATVSWGTVDFKFKNDRTYPIKINVSAKNGVVKISILGIPESVEYEVVIQSKIIENIPYTVQYIEDNTLEAGTEVVDQKGSNGCKSEAYKILKLNGNVVSSTLLSKDVYSALNRIVRRGTKNEENILTTVNTVEEQSADEVMNQLNPNFAQNFTN